MSTESIPSEADDKKIRLRDIAYSRSGDKADIANILVIPYDSGDWEMLRERLTTEVVADVFQGLVTGDVTRYELPGIHCLNFVLDGALAGGVSTSLRLDPHGKSYQSLMLEARI